MIVLTIFSVLDFSIKSCTIGEEKDDMMLNGRYAIEYVKSEIRLADKIISSSKIEGLNGKYPTNIGFLILIVDAGGNHNYITYYTHQNLLIRIACNIPGKKYPSPNDLKGNNAICEFIDDIEKTKFDPEQSLIKLDFQFWRKNGGELRLNTDIYIRCPMDY